MAQFFSENGAMSAIWHHEIAPYGHDFLKLFLIYVYGEIFIWRYVAQSPNGAMRHNRHMAPLHMALLLFGAIFKWCHRHMAPFFNLLFISNFSKNIIKHMNDLKIEIAAKLRHFLK